MTRIVALDTSGPALGLAALEETRTVYHHSLDGPARHIETAVVALQALFAALDWSPRAVDAVAYAAGPGSFTGLRIGAATAKAIALAADTRVISVDTLEGWALAEVVAREGAPTPLMVPLLDARKARRYAALFSAHPTEGDHAPSVERLSEDLDAEETACIALPLRHDATTAWCAPGPLADDIAQRYAAHGALPAASRLHCAIGVAHGAMQRHQRNQYDGPYDGPNYLRVGDIGARKHGPLFGDAATAPPPASHPPVTT